MNRQATQHPFIISPLITVQVVWQSVAFEWFRKSKGLKLIFSSDTNWMNMNKLWEIVRDRETWCAAVYGVANVWTRLSDLITTAANWWHWAFNFEPLGWTAIGVQKAPSLPMILLGLDLWPLLALPPALPAQLTPQAQLSPVSHGFPSV